MAEVVKQVVNDTVSTESLRRLINSALIHKNEPKAELKSKLENAITDYNSVGRGVMRFLLKFDIHIQFLETHYNSLDTRKKALVEPFVNRKDSVGNILNTIKFDAKNSLGGKFEVELFDKEIDGKMEIHFKINGVEQEKVTDGSVWDLKAENKISTENGTGQAKLLYQNAKTARQQQLQG